MENIIIEHIFKLTNSLILNINRICEIQDINKMKQEIKEYTSFIFKNINDITYANKHNYFNSSIKIFRDYYLKNLINIGLITDYEERNLEKDKFLKEFKNNIKKAILYCNKNNIKIDTKIKFNED